MVKLNSKTGSARWNFAAAQRYAQPSVAKIEANPNGTRVVANLCVCPNEMAYTIRQNVRANNIRLNNVRANLRVRPNVHIVPQKTSMGTMKTPCFEMATLAADHTKKLKKLKPHQSVLKFLTYSVILLLMLLPFKTSAQFSGGTGTESNPYIITTPAELAQLATYVNAGNATYNDKHYKLNNDLSLSDYHAGEGWTPIGLRYFPDTNMPFKGVFDGNGKKITELYMNNTSTDITYVGLFGNVENGTVKNLGVENVSITFTGDQNRYAGGIVGLSLANSNITNCYTTGYIETSSSSTTNSRAGGIVCFNEGTVSNCYSTCSVSADDIAGGVAAINGGGSILNSHSTCAINSGSFAGGVAGYNQSDGIVSYSYSTGSVTSGSWYAGGVVGILIQNSSVSHCYSTGSVNGTSEVGGVVGRCDNSSISHCYSTGSVNGINYVGGVIGFLNQNSFVSHCYATGSVNSSDVAGGIVGWSESSSVSNCYSTAIEIRAQMGDVGAGGIVGVNNNNSSVSNCYSIGYVYSVAPNSTSRAGGIVGSNQN
ncbi:MAG: hypothetical protein FWH18_06835, partial [Marinilabiliaceae bacterium]|nr:hypothetical protein [Marinilabiliaceae bacterium]